MFRILVAMLMKLYTYIGIFIINHLKQFSGPAINIVIIYRPECVSSYSDL